MLVFGYWPLAPGSWHLVTGFLFLVYWSQDLSGQAAQALLKIQMVKSVACKVEGKIYRAEGFGSDHENLFCLLPSTGFISIRQPEASDEYQASRINLFPQESPLLCGRPPVRRPFCFFRFPGFLYRVLSILSRRFYRDPDRFPG